MVLLVICKSIFCLSLMYALTAIKRNKIPNCFHSWFKHFLIHFLFWDKTALEILLFQQKTGLPIK